MPTPEQKVKNNVCKLLMSAGLFFFQVNNGATYDAAIGGYRGLSKWALKGVPDLIAIYKGQFIGIELKKSPKSKQSPDQVVFQKRLERNGGKYYLIGSLDQAKEMLRDLDIPIHL